MKMMNVIKMSNINLAERSRGGNSNLGGVLAGFLSSINTEYLTLEQLSEIQAQLPENPKMFGTDASKYQGTLKNPKYLKAKEELERDIE